MLHAALYQGYALNIAIGLQVFLGALTTALAAALTTGKKVGYMCVLLWEVQHAY